MPSEHYDRASKMPAGVAIATLLTSDVQCCRDDCDSWKTVLVDVIGQDIDSEDADEALLLRWSICLKHLGEFIDDMILKTPGTLFEVDEDEDCGDPDCPVHGYLHDDDDDEDEDDEDES